MKIFFREQDGKVLLIGKYSKTEEKVQAVFDSWEMARRMFPDVKAEKLKKGTKP